MTQEQIEWLKNNLRLSVKEEEYYTGDMDGSGSLYSTCKIIELTLNGEVIDSISFK